MLTLPNDLHDAIAEQLATVAPARWIKAAQALSERYRAPRGPENTALAVTSADALGYAALVMPATYAQLRGAMAATAGRLPYWQPATMLDLGSGPGTALWAAAAAWPSLSSFTAWDREPALLELGRSLARRSATPAVRATRWERRDLREIAGAAGNQRYDLVVLGHVLNELPAPAQAQIVEAAWGMASGLLLIVEPGTAAAFEVVRSARDQLLAAGAHTAAPCAHNRPCPLENDWCHFPQRLKRPEFQRRARGAPSEWEDSKFAYAAMARAEPETSIWGRVIREPTFNKAYAEALISSRDGIVQHRALKRHKAQFREVKDLVWGQTLSEPPGEAGDEG